MKSFLVGLFAAILYAGSASAAIVTFDITLDTDTVDGSGTLLIDDSFIAPNAKVYTQNVTASINFNGHVFSLPFSGATEFLMFDALGDEVASVGDDSGNFVDWEDSLDSGLFIELDEGANPGTFRTFGFQQTYRGNFEITRQLSVVPLPAGLPLFAAGIAGLYFLRRRKT